MRYCQLFVFLGVAIGRLIDDAQAHDEYNDYSQDSSWQLQNKNDMSLYIVSKSGGSTEGASSGVFDKVALRSSYYPAPRHATDMPAGTAVSFPEQRESKSSIDGTGLQKRAVILRRTTSKTKAEADAPGPSKLRIQKNSSKGFGSSIGSPDSTKSRISTKLPSSSLDLSQSSGSPRSAGFPHYYDRDRPSSPVWKKITATRQNMEARLPNPGRGLERSSKDVGLIPARAGIQLQGYGIGIIEDPSHRPLYFPTANRGQLPVYRNTYHHNQAQVAGKIFAQSSGALSHISAFGEGRHVQVNIEPGPNSSAYFETGSGDSGNRYAIVHGKHVQHNLSGPGESGTVRAIASLQGTGYLRITANNHGFGSAFSHRQGAQSHRDEDQF